MVKGGAMHRPKPLPSTTKQLCLDALEGSQLQTKCLCNLQLIRQCGQCYIPQLLILCLPTNSELYPLFDECNSPQLLLETLGNK